ncbi:MAG: hypothetical protein OHK0046_47960 [Anaerolineae bacterium]
MQALKDFILEQVRELLPGILKDLLPERDKELRVDVVALNEVKRALKLISESQQEIATALKGKARAAKR